MSWQCQVRCFRIRSSCTAVITSCCHRAGSCFLLAVANACLLLLLSLPQLFELLLSFVGPSRFRRQLEAALPQMVYVAVAYLQMTQVGHKLRLVEVGLNLMINQQTTQMCMVAASSRTPCFFKYACRKHRAAPVGPVHAGTM